MHYRTLLLVILSQAYLACALPVLLPGEVSPTTYSVHSPTATIDNHPSNSMPGVFSMPDFSSIASFASSAPSFNSNPRDPYSTIKDVTDMLNRHDTQTLIQSSIIHPLNQLTQQLTGDAGDFGSSSSGVSSSGAVASSFNAQQFGSLMPFGIQIPSPTTAFGSNDFSPPRTGGPSPPSSPGPNSGAPPPPGSPPSDPSSASSSADSLDLRDGDLTPSGPEPTSCGSKEFECQMLKACYGCYNDISLPHCTSCLLLKHCDKPDLPCQMQKSCRVCQAIRGKQQFYQPNLCGMLHC